MSVEIINNDDSEDEYSLTNRRESINSIEKMVSQLGLKPETLSLKGDQFQW